METQPRHGQLLGVHRGGWHRVAYTEWGSADNPHVVVCVHGLTRNSRDFDALAASLAPSCRVVCMDVVGRGDSDRLADGSAYGFPVYEPDVAALIARVTANADPRRLALDWVGTSMGGLLGITLAARAGTPIRRLVLNDIGPAQNADDVPQPLDLWKAWDRIRCPTLVLRGGRSDVLAADTARDMQARGPRARVVEFGGIGHAPWLMDEAQIAPVREFLLAS